jgi:hypothetical protein
MQLQNLIVISGLLASSLAFPSSPSAAPNSPTVVSSSNLAQHNITADTAHVNAMKNHPANHSIHSADLYSYLAKYAGSDYRIYVSDTRSYIDLSTVNLPPGNTSTAKVGTRDVPQYCIPYTNTYTKQTGSWYTNWRPAGYNPACLETGKSNDGGSQSMSWSYSLSISESAGLSWNIIKDVLSADLGISVTETYTTSSTTTCSVKANSVVQVWAQPYIAWGWFWSQKCYTCVHESNPGCDPEYVNGGATAPVEGRYNLGCSTGWDKVQGC